MDRKNLPSYYTQEDMKLINLFKEEMDRINLLYLKAVNSYDLTKANQLLKRMKSITDVLYKKYGEWADIKIPTEYIKGAKYIDNDNGINDIISLSEAEIERELGELGPIHEQAVNALLDNSKNYVRSSLDGMQRQAITMVNELQQQQVREELVKSIISGEGLFKMDRRVAQYFADNGITGFRDRGGKYWSMDRYVDMLTRTETSIANTQGTINRALELGITKFKVVERPDCCDLCDDYHEEIVDISKGVVELPPYHPNCRGYIIAVIEGPEGEEVEVEIEEKEEVNERAKTPEERIKKALDVIENSTMYLKYEQGAVVNMNGEIIRMATGTGSRVQCPRGDIMEPYIFTHNHNNSSSFSNADLDLRLKSSNQYGLRASGKLGTYSLYSESTRDKVQFVYEWGGVKKQYVEKGNNDLDSIADFWEESKYIIFKDGKEIKYKDNPYEFDKVFDEHYYKYLREGMSDVAKKTGVEFEYIKSDGVKKDTELNKLYLDKVKELDKIRKSGGKNYVSGDDIKVNEFI